MRWFLGHRPVSQFGFSAVRTKLLESSFRPQKKNPQSQCFNLKSYHFGFASLRTPEIRALPWLIPYVKHFGVHWRWDYASSSSTTMRPYDLLLKQKPQVVTAAQQRYLDVDPSYTLANVSFLIANGYPPTDSAAGGPSPLRYSLLGFKNAGNTPHWHSVLQWVQFDFDPAQFLVRRINSEAPPTGKAQKLWTKCAQALTQLLQQQVQRDDASACIPNSLFDQLRMFTKCLPTLLLWGAHLFFRWFFNFFR